MLGFRSAWLIFFSSLPSFIASSKPKPSYLQEERAARRWCGRVLRSSGQREAVFCHQLMENSSKNRHDCAGTSSTLQHFELKIVKKKTLLVRGGSRPITHMNLQGMLWLEGQQTT